MASYYHHFIQNFTISSPLHHLTNRAQPWDDSCATAFNRLKTTLNETSILAVPNAQIMPPWPGYGTLSSWKGRSLDCWRHYRVMTLISSIGQDHHGSAYALSWWPCVALECRYCQLQEEWGKEPSTVAAVQTSDSEGWWLPLTTSQPRQQQEADETLALVRGWLEMRQRPECLHKALW